MEKVLKQKRGITLITIIVTILVILILAGIVTHQLQENNGMFNNILKARNEINRNSAKEKLVIEINDNLISKNIHEVEDIKNNVLNNIEDSQVSGNSFPLVITIDSYTFKVNENGDVSDYDFDYMVEFNSNGISGEMDLQEFSFGESMKLNANQYSKDGYTFLHWNTKKDGSGENYNDEEYVSNLTSKKNSIVVLYAQWKQSSAEINGVYYDTLQEAITKAPNDGTETIIQIQKDTTENITIKSGQNIIFDLGGNKLNASINDAVITNNGTLKITNGTVESTFATGTINNNLGGTLIVDGGTITGKERSAIYNDKGDVFIYGDSYITSTATGFASKQKLERGAVHNLEGGTVTIIGGTIIGIKQQALTNMGTMIIGSKGDINIDSPVIIGKTYGIKSNGTLEIYDGIIKGITDPIWGSVTKREPNTDWTTRQEIIDKDTYTIQYLELVE